MNTKNIFSLALGLALLVTSCQQSDTTSTPGGGEASYTLTLDYDERSYQPGEPIFVTVTVEGRHAPNTEFPMHLVSSSDHVDITLEGAEFLADSTYMLPYEVVNSNNAVRVLHFTFTSQSSNFAEEVLDLNFRIPAAGGTQQALSIPITNEEQIAVTTTYDKTPIQIEKSLGITLRATKTNYTGELRVTLNILKGDGYFVVYGKNYRKGESFSLPIDTPQTIRYQPVVSGTQQLTFSLTDLVATTERLVEIEVYNKGGVENPTPGVYIYAQGWYYTLKNWSQVQDITPEGIAIVDAERRFLLASKATSKTWIAITDYPKYSKIPNLTIAAEESIAIEDMNGKRNTDALVRAVEEHVISRADAATFCHNYDPASPGKWYLMSAGQMNLLAQHIETVRTCQIALGADVIMPGSNYLTSTGRTIATIWAARYTIPFGQPGVLTINPYSVDSYHDSPLVYPICDL